MSPNTKSGLQEMPLVSQLHRTLQPGSHQRRWHDRAPAMASTITMSTGTRMGAARHAATMIARHHEGTSHTRPTHRRIETTDHTSGHQRSGADAQRLETKQQNVGDCTSAVRRAAAATADENAIITTLPPRCTSSKMAASNQPRGHQRS